MLLTIASWLLFSVTLGDACLCSHSHPQQHFCTKDGEDAVFVAQVEVTKEENVRILGGPEKVAVTTFEVDPSDPESLRKFIEAQRNLVDPDSIRYTYKLEKDFKSSDQPSEYKGFLYTEMKENLCGIRLQTDKRYLVTGHVGSDGRYHMDVCDPVIALDQTTEQELKRAIGFLGETLASCNNGCRVKTCEESDEDCTPEEPLKCVWSWASQIADTYGNSNGFSGKLCLRTDENTCVWKNQKE